jgi:hypothetical protein
MRKKILPFVVVAIVALLPGDSFAEINTYYVWQTSGGTWADADKSWSGDWNLCWAGAASNVLEYTGWGKVGGMTTTDDMFAEYVDHFSDLGSLPNFAWDWWWDGTNPTQGWAGWAQEDVGGGGGFYPTLNVNDYLRSSSSASAALSNIDQWMHDGYGVTLAIRGSIDHAITAWGFDYDTDAATYTGIYVTDSDDNVNSLRRYALSLTSGAWYMTDYGNNRYIGEVYALQMMVPVPGAVLLGMLGLSIAGARLRKMRA